MSKNKCVNSPLSLMSQTTTMAPRLANLRDRSLPNPPPPPVTRAISPFMLFILYFFGINDLTIASSIAKIDIARKTITSPMEYRYVMITVVVVYTKHCRRSRFKISLRSQVMRSASLRLKQSIVQLIISRTTKIRNEQKTS